MLEDRAGRDVGFLAQNLKIFLDAAHKRPELGTLIPTFWPNDPQVFVKVDHDKAVKQGIDLSQVYQTLQTFMGGFFVNYFNRFGRTWQVYIEAEGDYRTDANNVGQFYVRNSNGDPVPLDAISTIQNIAGPEFTLRYNEYRAAQINGSAAPGYSSYQAMNAILIVEFAKDEYEKGKPLLDAALEGARLRLRPILMTSFAFIFGLLPLWFATGSGAVARRVLGSTVIGGMIAATAIAIFLIPVTFYVIERLFAGRKKEAEAPSPPKAAP